MSFFLDQPSKTCTYRVVRYPPTTWLARNVTRGEGATIRECIDEPFGELVDDIRRLGLPMTRPVLVRFVNGRPNALLFYVSRAAAANTELWPESAFKVAPLGNDVMYATVESAVACATRTEGCTGPAAAPSVFYAAAYRSPFEAWLFRDSEVWVPLSLNTPNVQVA